jgi:hypothetical protein
LTDTNGTAEPGTMVVGSTPFQRSACTNVTKFGLVPSALALASMAAAWASPLILMFVAWASLFSAWHRRWPGPRRGRRWLSQSPG